MISIYSVISSIIFYNLGLFILFVLRRKTDFMARYAISTLLLLSVLSMVRLVLPIDFDAAHVIRSETILPKLIDIIARKRISALVRCLVQKANEQRIGVRDRSVKVVDQVINHRACPFSWAHGRIRDTPAC